jgi:hypothetical protein
MEELGGKKAFMKGVSGRLGLPLGSKIASHVVKVRAQAFPSPPC